MLDAFIIEELKRREREEERDGNRRPELPTPSREDAPVRQGDDNKPQQGVVIIDYSV